MEQLRGLQRQETQLLAQGLIGQLTVEEAVALAWDGLCDFTQPLDEGEQQLIRELGLACYRDMLEQIDNAPDRAIALAGWGARLYRYLLEETAGQPDWVAIHEEQFCRYGSIWIHQKLTDERTTDSAESLERLRQQGIRLLSRLSELYPQPPEWVPLMRQTLQQLRLLVSPQTGPGQGPAGPRLTLVGNCQTHPLMLGLSQLLPNHEIYFCKPVHLATLDDVADLHRILADTDILVMHRVLPGYRDNIGLDCRTLEALLPSQAQQLVLPNLHYEGYHPLIGYALDGGGRLGTVASESPLGDYHDFLAMVAASQSLTAAQLLELPLTQAMAELLRQWHQSSLQQLQQREKDCDLALSDWIAKQYRVSPLFHTFNHPSNQLIEQLLACLLAKLEPDLANVVSPLGEFEYLGQQHHGVLPWVREALELHAWAAEAGQRDWDCSWSLEQQVQESIEFYRHYSWIGEENQGLEKYQLATRLLDLALDDYR